VQRGIQVSVTRIEVPRGKSEESNKKEVLEMDESIGYNVSH